MKQFPALSLNRLLLAIVGLIVTAVLVFVAFRMGPLAPVKVTTLKVENKVLVRSIFGVGTVEAQQSWLLGPLAAGRVLHVHVEVGQQVKAGQLLAEMEPLDLDQRLKAQEASWVKANSLQNSAKAQLEDARSRLDVASANWLRQNELARQNFISMAALESREQERVSAATAYQIAQANLNAANQDIHRIQADKLAASVLRQSMRLVAPAGAVVISRDAEAGSTVLAGQAVLRLANPGSLWIKTRVDQGRSLGLAVGLSAHIVLRSHPQQHFDGKVQRVEWQSDAVTEERIAQVSFDTMPAGVSMGEMAEVTLSLPPSPPSLLIPQACVQQHQGRTGVWKLKSNHIEFTDVKWGAFSLDGWVQALEGLKVGDEVVVYSEKPLQPNTRFRVVSDLIAKPQS